ncbi:MAG TPA: dienelactone hydrolase family protein [Acidovorax sp.]|nr:dienelactone hydrolase family protein [Acidovorax sp.]
MPTITLNTPDGFSLPALHVPSATGTGQPLVLIQEIFGINAAMREAAQHWAALGFEVLCPDLFARQRPGVDLDPTQPEQFQAGIQLMMGMDQDLAIRDLEAARQWFADREAGARVIALGYCLGGRLAVRMALETPVAATVSYYGVGLEQLLPASPAASAPCLLHIAGNDGFVPPPAREIILAEVAKRPALQAHVYEGCDHAFARPHGEHYNAAAAELAQTRTLAFLRA